MFHNKDVFICPTNNLCGVDQSIIEHSLIVDPKIKPQKQKLRKIFEERAKGARAKVK